MGKIIKPGSRNNILVCSLCAVVLGVSIPGPSIFAEEGGTGHVAPGGVATLIDAAPTRPGWVVEPIYVHYEGEFKTSKQVPIGGLISFGLDATVDTFTLGALYTFDKKVWGAYYSAGIYVPYAWMDIKGNVNERQVHDRAQGIGDITLIPGMLAWKNDYWQYETSLSIYAPTGDYTAGKLANPGLNYWTADPMIGASYSNDDTGLNFGVHAGVTFNSENSATDYDSGSMFHIESSMQKLFPLGKGFMALGVDAFYFEQITSDSGSGARQDFKGRTLGVGPVINYILPLGSDSLVIEAKWLPESNTNHRLDGDYIWLKAAYQFE